MTNKMNTLVVDDVSLEVKWIGLAESQKPVLVFLHEGLGCVALWRDFPEKLCDSWASGAWHLAAKDMAHQTPSPCPGQCFMHHEGLTVLPKVFDAAGIDQAILIGHSDGGSISLINAGVCRTPESKPSRLAAHVFNEDITVQSIAEAKIAYETTNLRERLAKYHGDNVDCAFGAGMACGWIQNLRTGTLRSFSRHLDTSPYSARRRRSIWNPRPS